MQVDVGEFIDRLRGTMEELTEIGLAYNYDEMFWIFDRACVKVLVAGHRETKPQLTSGQKAAATRARNRAERARQQANGSAQGQEATDATNA